MNEDKLIEGILAQAAKDWIYSAAVLQAEPPEDEAYADALRMKIETERFFRSKWYKQLTTVDGSIILAQAKKLVKLNDCPACGKPPKLHTRLAGIKKGSGKPKIRYYAICTVCGRKAEEKRLAYDAIEVWNERS